MWQAYLAGKQFRYDRDPQGKHEENVGNSHLVTTRQLVWLPTDMVHVESSGEYHSSDAEQDH